VQHQHSGWQAALLAATLQTAAADDSSARCQYQQQRMAIQQSLCTCKQ